MTKKYDVHIYKYQEILKVIWLICDPVKELTTLWQNDIGAIQRSSPNMVFHRNLNPALVQKLPL
jgi:peptide methionine sulfoxide reductase MsrA